MNGAVTQMELCTSSHMFFAGQGLTPCQKGLSWWVKCLRTIVNRPQVEAVHQLSSALKIGMNKVFYGTTFDKGTLYKAFINCNLWVYEWLIHM